MTNSIKLTEREGHLFLSTAFKHAKEIDYPMKASEWDFLYGLDEDDHLVIAFIHTDGNNQVDIDHTDNGYLMTFWQGDYIYADMFLDTRGRIINVQFIDIPTLTTA